MLDDGDEIAIIATLVIVKEEAAEVAAAAVVPEAEAVTPDISVERGKKKKKPHPRSKICEDQNPSSLRWRVLKTLA